MSTGMSRRTRSAAASACLLAIVALGGCGRDYQGAPTASGAPAATGPAAVVQESDPGAYHAVELAAPLSKPAQTLVDTSGDLYSFADRTAGRVVLVYAGYTHCPDVCPTTVADLAAALRGLPRADRSRIDVVMFSTDPRRDTPQRLRAWLDQFDSGFVGLTGPQSTVLAAINDMGIDVQAPVRNADGSVSVEHGAQVLAFSPPDDRAHLLWTSGTTAAEYREDLTTLLAENS